MVQVMDALAQMPRNERLSMLIDREPRPLYRILDNNGYAYSALARQDYLYEILIWHKDPGPQ